MKNHLVTLTTALSLLGLTGCASIMSGGMDHVSVTANPENAAFVIKDENGKTVQQGTTPTNVTLERSDGYFDGQTYQVSFSAVDYASKTVPLDTHINGWYVGNLIFGGALGLLVIDPATGAMWDLPDNLDAKLTANKLPTTTGIAP